MTNNAKTAEIEKLEQRIEQLAEEVIACRKLVTLSRIAIGAGGGTMVATLTGLVQLDPLVLLSGVTLVIGGIVFYGSNKSTLEEKRQLILEAEARRADLISNIGLRLVE